MNHQKMIKPMLIGAGVLVILGALGVPVLGYAPLLILLLCPVMMVFMMWGMGHGDKDRGSTHNTQSRNDRR